MRALIWGQELREPVTLSMTFAIERARA